MIWISIILGIIQAIPSIIKLIQMIMEAIRNKKPEERVALEHEFHGILAHWHHKRDHGETETALKDFATKLGVTVA